MLLYLYSSDLKSLDYYPNNVLSDFRIQLPQRHQLEGEWEIALMQAQIPFSWVDEISASLYVRYEIRFYFDYPKRSNPDVLVRTSKTGTYHSFIGALDKKTVNNLATILNSQTSVIKFTRNKSTRHMQFRIVNSKIKEEFTYNQVSAECVSVQLSSDLAEILGFTQTKFLFDKNDPSLLPSRTIVAENSPFLPFKMTALAIHCDLAESQLVNNSYAPVLRVIETNRKNGEKMQTSTFQTPIYIPMRETHFNSIRIQVLDLDGKRVQFESGTVIVCVDIRPKQKNYIS